MNGLFSYSEGAILKLQEILQAKKIKFELFIPIGDEENALFSTDEAFMLMKEGKKDFLIEHIIDVFEEKTADFILVKGLDSEDVPAFRMNADIASNLGVPAILIEKDKGTSILADIFREKMISVLGIFKKTEDLTPAVMQALTFKSPYKLPKKLEAELVKSAKSNPQRIVLPEGGSERILRAASLIAARRIAYLTLLGNEEEVLAHAQKLGITLNGISIINPVDSPKFKEYADTLYELRKSKGMTPEQAVETMKDSAYFGTMMVYKGDADGMVSGAEHTTAHTIRPALQFIKTKPGISCVSGAFLMCFNGKLYVFSDCAVTPNPTPEQLAEIAITTAETARIFGLDPKVAFLSYGTGTSGKGPSVDAINQAVALAKEKAPELALEGPIQYDAAIDMNVAQTKLPDSPVAGRANVFIFPDLNTGNCCYKAVQRASRECLAIGPVLQGLKKPVNDLSRGCTIPDIINTVAFTALFAANDKEI